MFTTFVEINQNRLVILQPIYLVVLADLFVGFGFDLADTLASDAEFTADLFESMSDAIIQSMSHLQDLAFLF